MIPSKITRLLETASTHQPHFPPTLLYNEGWMLRLVMDWFSDHELAGHPLNFEQGSTWFSEALLPSAFLPRFRGDSLGEARTHVDGAIGNFLIGEKGKADLKLQAKATQFSVLEAKIFSSLSGNTKNVKAFDQAARNVACIAEVLRRANRHPLEFRQLGFYVLAPESQVDMGIFEKQMRREAILERVMERVAAYEQEKIIWFEEWFKPTIEMIELKVLSWESVEKAIRQKDKESSDQLEEFLGKCLRYN